MWNDIKVSDWLGWIITEIQGEEGGESLQITFSNGEKFEMYHAQDCCEYVYIESIVGELTSLVGNPLLLSEEVSHSDENPEGVKIPEYQDSFTWTFYKFATIKGYVDIRRYGASNGYYGESVDIRKIN